MKKIVDIFLILVLIASLGSAIYFGSIYFTEKQKTDKSHKMDVEVKQSLVIDEPKSKNKVDWEKAKKEYPTIQAWIEIPGTKIDYPILQGEDNSYYLNRDYKGDWDFLGSIFMDYRQDPDFSKNLNTFIYGHTVDTRWESPKFGELANYYDEKFFNEHRTVYIYTPNKVYEGTVFGVHSDSADTRSREMEFLNQTDFLSYAKFMKDNSSVKNDFDVSNIKNMITLWACTEAEITNTNGEYVNSNLSRTFVSVAIDDIE